MKFFTPHPAQVTMRNGFFSSLFSAVTTTQDSISAAEDKFRYRQLKRRWRILFPLLERASSGSPIFSSTPL
jgi:hypothetical protein